MKPDDLMVRIAGVLRHTVGPQVGDEFSRTQAFMAAVVLEGLSGQLGSAYQRDGVDESDAAALERDLMELLGDQPFPTLRAAIGASDFSTDAGLGAVISMLWAQRAALGIDRFEVLLGWVRVTLRARLDRELEYSA